MWSIPPPPAAPHPHFEILVFVILATNILEMNWVLTFDFQLSKLIFPIFSLQSHITWANFYSNGDTLRNIFRLLRVCCVCCAWKCM